MAHWTNRILSFWLGLTNNWGTSCWLISFMSFISIVVWPTAGLRFRFDEKTSTTTDRKEFDRFNWSCKFPYLKFLISVVCSHLIEHLFMNEHLFKMVCFYTIVSEHLLTNCIIATHIIFMTEKNVSGLMKYYIKRGEFV